MGLDSFLNEHLDLPQGRITPQEIDEFAEAVKEQFPRFWRHVNPEFMVIKLDGGYFGRPLNVAKPIDVTPALTVERIVLFRCYFGSVPYWIVSCADSPSAVRGIQVKSKDSVSADHCLADAIRKLRSKI